jgi:ankyrin repeat protein
MNIAISLLLSLAAVSAGPPPAFQDARPEEARYEEALAIAAELLALHGQSEPLEVLLERHPNLPKAVEKRLPHGKPTSDDHSSLLHYAAQSRDPRTVEMLIRKGANINSTRDDGWTPLHVAAKEGDVEMVKLLIERGADVNAKTKGRNAITAIPLNPSTNDKPRLFPAIPSRTPLDIAREWNQLEVVRLLQRQKK